MNTATKTIESARGQIQDILKRYNVSWEDVAPDIDEDVWNTIRPTIKMIRRRIFQKKYPSLYARLSRQRRR